MTSQSRARRKHLVTRDTILSETRRSGLASQFRNELFKTARARSTLTYGYLMRRFSLSRGRAITGLLSDIDRTENESGSPGFAALVVRKDTGYPGGGFFCDQNLPIRLLRPPERCTDPRLTPEEKAYVRAKRRVIWEYYSKSGIDWTTTSARILLRF